jgi:ABC-2 type transport system ATP-binding protein
MTENKPIIELQQFEKYYGSIHAVKPLDLQVFNAETFVLLGPNGSGKSTIIRALAGLHFPTGGKIFVDGKNITTDSVEYKKQISYMPQRVTMPDRLTAREIITLFAGFRNVETKKIDEIIEFVELEDSADRYARGFSGGMLQRIGLAIAFLSDAKIFILDEPTLNLDPLGISRLRELILKLKREGKTFIFSSHILEDAIQLADRVGILVDGELAKVEPISEFKKSIAKETSVRVRLSNQLDNLENILVKKGAEKITIDEESFTFKAVLNRRLSIIKSIESAGGIIEEIHTDAPNWEVLLHKHFNNNRGH